MTRTQIQLPDALYAQAKCLAEAKEISLAELVRRGLEYMLTVSAPAARPAAAWKLPEPMHLGAGDPFSNPDWRCHLYMSEARVAEPGAAYGRTRKTGRRARP